MYRFRRTGECDNGVREPRVKPRLSSDAHLFTSEIAVLGLEAAGSSLLPASYRREEDMPDSVYKVIELIGSSNESWEKAAANAVSLASKSLRDLRVAEVVELDLQLDSTGKVEAYRAKLNVSFKFEGS
jgi:dodecin